MDSMFILHYSYLMREYKKDMPINDVTGVHTGNMANNMYMYNSVYEIKILHQHIQQRVEATISYPAFHRCTL